MESSPAAHDTGTSASDAELRVLPKSRIAGWLSPVRRVLKLQATSGLLLMATTAIAMIAANSPWSGPFLHFWETPCVIAFGDYLLKKDLLHVINDGLMTIFFFVVGLEIKREVVSGELSDLRKATLPIVAAIGGMIVPATVFLLVGSVLSLPAEAVKGWTIPMATDIAFVVGLLSLFGNRVPIGLKILLLSLAIVDDLGAVILIAVLFTEHLALLSLGIGAGGVVLTFLMNRIGVRSVGLYVVVGAITWLAVLKSGVHPTIAGVVLGLMTPGKAWVPYDTLAAVLDRLRAELSRFTTQPPTADGHPQPVPHSKTLHDDLAEAEFATRESIAPLYRLEHLLHPWVAFLIMPLFALANAGVPLDLSQAFQPVAICVAVGLALGKPLGIFGLSYIAVMLRIAKLPEGVSWKLYLGGACLAGIGFTMSLFLGALALPEELIPSGKLGTLMGSAVSATLGMWLIAIMLPKAKTQPEA
ncbi:MAG: Na+/H+ antiporter NhaA [Planctomyces sp.]|nr:Na+/H+ antiporter NhaA [Planctomyces sp.]